MAYGDFKDLPRRTPADKVLLEKAFNIAKILNMMNINVNLLQWFIIFLIKSLPVVLSHVLSQKPQLRKVCKINLLCQTKN